MSLNISNKFVSYMNKVVITTISSIMTLLILTMMTNPVVASVDEEEEDEDSDRGDYDARNDYTRAECAEMFPTEYDYSGFQTCTGDIGWPNPGP